MRIIELIGPSGVGKSTFYRNLQQNGAITDWPVPEEAAQKILKENPDRKINFSIGDRFLLEQKLNSPRLNSMTAIEKYDYLGFCFRKMKAEAIIRETDAPYTVFGENHIFHGFNLELLALAQRSDDHFTDYLTNRKFIFLKKPHQTIVDNRINRKESGVYRPGMTRFDHAYEWASVEVYFERMKLLEGLFTKYDVPFITLNMDENVSVYDEQINRFIGD